MQRKTVFIPIADYEYTLANEIKSDYNTHRASTTYHVAADSTNAVSSSDSTTLATVLTLANEIKTDYNAHLVLDGVHVVDDAHNRVNADNAIDEDSVFTLLNEIKVKYTKHIADTEVHKEADTTQVITSTEAADDTPDIDIGLNQGNALLVQLFGSGCTGTVDFQSTVDGATFTNCPYIQKNSITAAKSVTQIASPSTATEYIVLPPLTQARIACAVTVGYMTVVYREIEYSRPFDGAADNEKVLFGGVAAMQWQTDDANANVLAIILPEGGGTDVPVFVIGDTTAEKDLTWFNGVTEPRFAVVDDDGDSYIYIGHSGDDVPVLATAGTGANGIVITNPKNAAASALSGTQLDVEIDIGGAAYHFTVYPTKA